MATLSTNKLSCTLTGIGIRLIFLFTLSTAAMAGSDSISVHFPQSPAPGNYFISAGVNLTIMPRAVVEEEIRQIPMIDIYARHGLPWNFSFTGHLSTIYIANQLSLGIWWSYSTSGISFAIGDLTGFWFGFADMEGFNTTAIGLLNYPTISAGISIDDLFLTIREEALIAISQHTFIGSVDIGRVNVSLTGTATSLIVEQPVWLRHRMALIFKMYYARPQFQTWLAFTPNNRWLLFPELTLGYIW